VLAGKASCCTTGGRRWFACGTAGRRRHAVPAIRRAVPACTREWEGRWLDRCGVRVGAYDTRGRPDQPWTPSPGRHRWKRASTARAAHRGAATGGPAIPGSGSKAETYIDPARMKMEWPLRERSRLAVKRSDDRHSARAMTGSKSYPHPRWRGRQIAARHGPAAWMFDADAHCAWRSRGCGVRSTPTSRSELGFQRSRRDAS